MRAVVFTTSVLVLYAELLLTRYLSILLSPYLTLFVIAFSICGLGLGAMFVSLKYSNVSNREPILRRWIGILATTMSLFPPLILAFPWLAPSGLPLVCFFFAGGVLSLSYMKEDRPERLYPFDLLGAAFGLILIIFFLQVSDEVTALLLLSLLSLNLFHFLIQKKSSTVKLIALQAVLLLLILVNVPNDMGQNRLIQLPLQAVSNFRTSMKTQLDDENGRIVESASRYFIRTDRVQTNDTDQQFIYGDGRYRARMVKWRDEPSPRLRRLMGVRNIPYADTHINSVLDLGAGAGLGVAAALWEGVKEITAVEINDAMIEMVEAQSEYNGDIFHRNGVTVINQEARDYVMQNNETKFDLVSLTLMESLPVFSLANSRIHSYIFTTEALRDYASVLSHDGYISVVETSWPHMVKILGMLNEAWNQGLLSDGAVANDDSFFKHIFVCEIKEIPGEEYVPFRYLVLFRKSSIDPKTESLLSSRTLTNNHTILLAPSGPRKLLHKETTELLNLAVATDDFPYFYHIQSMRKENGGFLILLVSLLFLMLIIYIRSSGAQEKNMATSLRSAFYFSLTGSAFMMIESGLLYHACFVLSIPTLATAITLLGILTGAASSSWISAQMDLSNRMIRTWMFLLISCLVIASISLPIFKEITTFRSLAILVVMYGLGVLLGVAFPLGLRHFRDPKSSSVGWYYGFSALGTVVGVVLFLLVSEEWGIRAALILGTGLYLCSFIFMGRVTSPLRSSQ